MFRTRATQIWTHGTDRERSERHPDNMMREECFSLNRSWKPLLHSLKDRKKALSKEKSLSTSCLDHNSIFPFQGDPSYETIPGLPLTLLLWDHPSTSTFQGHLRFLLAVGLCPPLILFSQRHCLHPQVGGSKNLRKFGVLSQHNTTQHGFTTQKT